jgi:hypothetical protein
MKCLLLLPYLWRNLLQKVFFATSQEARFEQRYAAWKVTAIKAALYQDSSLGTTMFSWVSDTNLGVAGYNNHDTSD